MDFPDLLLLIYSKNEYPVFNYFHLRSHSNSAKISEQDHPFKLFKSVDLLNGFEEIFFAFHYDIGIPVSSVMNTQEHFRMNRVEQQEKMVDQQVQFYRYPVFRNEKMADFYEQSLSALTGHQKLSYQNQNRKRGFCTIFLLRRIHQ